MGNGHTCEHWFDQLRQAPGMLCKVSIIHYQNHQGPENKFMGTLGMLPRSGDAEMLPSNKIWLLLG